jgi:ketosteroid isomerase-like protein
MNTDINTDATATVVDSFFTRFGAGDMPGVLDLFTDTIDFAVNGAPNVPWSGGRSTRAELAEFFASFGQVLTASEEFTITTKVIDGDNAVALGRNKFGVLATGKKFTNDFALHFTVQHGKITGYHMYEDSYAISTAFTD